MLSGDDDDDEKLSQIGDRLNAESDRIGFLRMTNRSHTWNSSCYSLGSLVSLNDITMTPSRHRLSVRSTSSSRTLTDDAKSPLTALYDLLVGPMEDVLPPVASGSMELILVLQGDLYLVPFALLRPTQASQYLFERYSLLIAPSVRAVQANQAISETYNPNCTGALVVGNPKIPPSVTSSWQWRPLPTTEYECRLVGEMLGCRCLTGSGAAKDAVLKSLSKAEVIHFSTNVSWKLSAIVLSPSSNEADAPLTNFLLTAADILNTSISARLVVLNSAHMNERTGRMSTDGLIGLTRSFLAAGAQCVLVPLWPVSEPASRLLFKSFYTALLQGTRASHALAMAMHAVRSVRELSHASNWAGWMLVGSDVRVCSQVALMSHGLKSLLVTPIKSREAMRVVLHLVSVSFYLIH